MLGSDSYLEFPVKKIGLALLQYIGNSSNGPVVKIIGLVSGKYRCNSREEYIATVSMVAFREKGYFSLSGGLNFSPKIRTNANPMRIIRPIPLIYSIGGYLPHDLGILGSKFTDFL